MTDRFNKPAFVRRFDELRWSIRRAELWHGVFWVLLVAAGGLAALAAADYLLELAWPVRAAGLGGLACVAAWVALRMVFSPWQWWSRPRTAVEIEQRFPQLGQRVRTVIEFSGRAHGEVTAEGVAPALVAALEDDTHLQAQPLDLGAVVPRRKLLAAGALAVLPVALLLTLACWDWQWRLAIGRALLGDRPYTELSVAPGDMLVEEGQDAAISVELTGRLFPYRQGKQVILYWRPAEAAGTGPAKSAWSRLELAPEDARPRGQNALVYAAALKELRQPIQYRAVAGRLQGQTYRIDVRYPIALKDFKATLTPPTYTGVDPSTVEGGDLDVIEGTRVRFEIELDRPCTEAALVLCEPPYLSEEGQPQPAPQRIALQAGGFSKSRLETELEFREDKSYWLVARAADGTQLAENRYQVRVRKDRPPEIHFEDPEEALEVHPLAEVLMRVRAGDDFGLSRAGVVFQVNHGQEHTLLLKDFPAATDGPPLVDGHGRPEIALIKRVLLEETLPLEDHNLSPTQAITYYAFAEDNYPQGPRRMETDLRYIDIRQFKRLYKVGGT